MSSFFVCLNAIAPVFVLIALGYLAKRAGILREELVPAMNTVAFKVFMPLMCFYNIYSSDLSASVRPRLLLFAVAGILAVYCLSVLTGRLLEPRPRSRSAMIQTLFQSNYLILGIPVASSLVPGADTGVITLLAAVTGPLYNVLAVTTLTRLNGGKTSPGKLLADILRNPMVYGSLLGVAFLLLRIPLPVFLHSAVRDAARVASPLMLFLLGAFFRFSGFKDAGRDLAAICAGRLVVFPALALPCAVLLGFRGVEFAALLTLFAAPSAVATFTMAQQMGGDAPLAGNAVMLTSLFCSVTLFGWSLLFKSLGIF